MYSKDSQLSTTHAIVNMIPSYTPSKSYMNPVTYLSQYPQSTYPQSTYPKSTYKDDFGYDDNDDGDSTDDESIMESYSSQLEDMQNRFENIVSEKDKPIVTSPIKDEIIDEEIRTEIENDDENSEKEQINEKQNPILPLFGYEFDLDSLIVHFIIIVIWVFIWYGTGLRVVIGKDLIFSLVFVIFILYNIVSIMTAGTSSGGVVYELNILLTVEQMVSILFGTVVLFSLFHKNIPVNENCKSIINRICISNVIILTISSLWVSVWTSGRAFRSIRKFKQGIYNIALTLFVMVGIIFIKGNCDN